MAGRVIYLNGTSSAGKTAIALALQDELDEPFHRIGVDAFVQMLPRRSFDGSPFEPAPGGGVRPRAAIRELVRQPMAGVLAAMAATSDLIVDDVINGSDWLRTVVRALAPYTVLFAGVHCPMDELERRERARGDRMIGVARGMLDAAHEHGVYDLTLDTSMMTPPECARAIKERLVNGPAPTAFAELRARL